MTDPLSGSQYVTSLEEVLWGSVLVALTLAIHGTGTVFMLNRIALWKVRFHHETSFTKGITVLVVASWMILLTHLLEVVMWAAFFLVSGAQPTHSLAFYVALMDYTTLGCDVTFPERWQLLGGMIAVAGLLTFAWSTGVLLTLAQDFQARELERLRRHREGS